MLGLISAILPVALQILGWFLNRSKVSEENKKQFFEWLKLAGDDMGSVKLMNYADSQIEWLKTHPWKEST